MSATPGRGTLVLAVFFKTRVCAGIWGQEMRRFFGVGAIPADTGSSFLLYGKGKHFGIQI